MLVIIKFVRLMAIPVGAHIRLEIPKDMFSAQGQIS